jgi:hypothetical protein
MTAGGRLLLSVVLAAVVVVGGFTFERVVGPAPSVEAPSVAAQTGAWFCPHGGGDGWHAWVAVSNVGDVPARLAVRTVAEHAPPRTERSELEAGRQRLIPVPAERMATGTTVEFFGSPVVAGMVVSRPNPGGVAAEPCAAATGTRWFIPEGTSVRGQDSQIVIVNPSVGEAVVDVTLTKEDEILAPGKLEGVVLDGRSAVAFDLNRFALGERTLTATVTAALGEVVAAGVGVTSSGIREVLAVPAPSTSWIVPAAGDAASGDLLVTAPEGEAPFVVTSETTREQTPALQDASVDARTADSFEITGPDAGLFVDSEGPGPFVAARRLTAAAAPEPAPEPRARTRRPGKEGGKGRGRRPAPEPPPPPPADQAATAGAADSAVAWAVAPALPPDGGRSLLLLQNAEAEDATVSVTLLGKGGATEPPELQGIAVPAGRMKVLELEEVAGRAPHTAIVRASSGAVVASQAGISDSGYAVTVGLPLPTD